MKLQANLIYNEPDSKRSHLQPKTTSAPFNFGKVCVCGGGGGSGSNLLQYALNDAVSCDWLAIHQTSRQKHNWRFSKKNISQIF